jgi:hypothetical protein
LWVKGSVYKGKVNEYEEGAVSNKDCIETVKKIYTNYLYPVTVSTTGSLENADCDLYEAHMEAICERDDELAFATKEFLEVVLGCSLETIEEEYGHGFIEQVLDDFCEYLANDHLISVFRPTFNTNDNGDEVFTKYPYHEITGDIDPYDETN